jgi:hypothetical protein
MQLALSADVLVPLGAGAAALAVALVVAFTHAWRRRRHVPAARRLPVGDSAAARSAPLPPAAPPVRDAPVETAHHTEHTAAELTAARIAEARRQVPEAAADGAPERHPGSGRDVGAAVSQAFVARAAAARRASVPEPAGEPPERAEQVPVRADARDRLLAVLLADPVRAVGAATELEASRQQLDRLSEAMRHERVALAGALNRLAAAGLAPEQLARLAGLPVDEVRALLATAG